MIKYIDIDWRKHMNKKLKMSCMAVTLAGIVTGSAFVTACTTKQTVTTHYSVDNRTAQYGVFDDVGEQLEAFKDMYKAIAYCVDEGSEDYYVAKIAGKDVGEKVFILRDYYDAASSDQFFYYRNGTSLDRYTPWKQGDANDLLSNSNDCIVVMKTLNGLQNYFQGTEIVKVDEEGLGTVVPSYNLFPCFDASVQVNLPAYCGVTKAEYKIRLSEAQIYPTYEGYETTYAKIGFLIPDAFFVGHMGFAADTTTGEWYYYEGQGEYSMTDSRYNDAYNEVTDWGVKYEKKSVLSSTWNEEGGYFSPNSDVTLTAEIVPVAEDGEDYYVYQLTMELENGKKIVRQYENSKMTACATLRFFAALDVYMEDGMPSFDNGAQFKNLKITSATGTIFERSLNPDNYGDNLVELQPGDYNLLNSMPASPTRFNTIVYNRAVVSYNFDTLGQDIYNFSYRMNEDANALSDMIKAAKDAIDAISNINALTAADADKVKAARAAYDALTKNVLVNTAKTDILSDLFQEENYLEILLAAEQKLG